MSRKEKIAAETLERVRTLLAWAARTKAPYGARRMIAIRDFAEMSNLTRATAMRTLRKMDEAVGGRLLVNVGTSTSARWVLSVEVLQEIAPEFGLADNEDSDRLTTRLMALESKVARLEKRIAALTPAPEPGEWASTKAIATLLGRTAVEIGRIGTELGIRRDPTMVRCRKVHPASFIKTTEWSRNAFSLIRNYIEANS